MYSMLYKNDLIHSSQPQPYEVGTITVPILQMRKWRQRNVKQLPQSQSNKQFGFRSCVHYHYTTLLLHEYSYTIECFNYLLEVLSPTLNLMVVQCVIYFLIDSGQYRPEHRVNAH